MSSHQFDPMFDVILDDLKRTYGGSVLLMPAQAAKAFGFSEKAFYTQLSRGGIPIRTVGVGRRMRFSIYEIAKYLSHAVDLEPAVRSANPDNAPSVPEERSRTRKTNRPASRSKRQAQDIPPQEKKKASGIEFVLGRPPLGPELAPFLGGVNG